MFLSIIIPSFNQGNFIKNCFKSIRQLKKKYNHIEILLIDSCSTDQTHSLIEEYKEIFDVVIIEHDNGQSHALKKGFDLASGYWLTWINTDDYISSNVINILNSNFVIQEKPDVVYGDSWRLVDDKLFYKTTPLNSQNLLWRNYNFVQPSVFFTKNIYDKSTGVDVNLNFVMDWDLFFQLKNLQAKFTYIPAALSTVIIHDNQKSRSNKFCDRLNRVDETYKVISRYSTGPYVDCYYKSFKIFSYFKGFGFDTNIGIIIWTFIIFFYFKICLISYNTINFKNIWHALKTMKT